MVTETYLPEINGVAMTMGELVKGLLRRGHHIQMVRPRQYPAEVPRDSRQYEELLLRGIPIPRYDGLKLGLPAAEHLLRQWQWKRPDIVHLVTEGPLAWSALRVALRLGLPVVSDFHTNFHSYTRHYGIGWLKTPITAYLRYFHNSTLCTIVPTTDLLEELRVLGFRNLAIVARGVDTQLFNPARRDPVLRQIWGAAPGDPVAICVGRMAPEKNLPLLLETFEVMRQVNPRAKLVVVGDGPERMKLLTRHPHVRFAGARVGTDLAAHYASADMFLYPSLTETYGNVTVEAMASGLATLAFRYAAAAQHIGDDANGVTVAYGEHESFIRAAIDLMQQGERRARLGRAARASMLRVDWADIVSQFEAALIRMAVVTGEERVPAPAFEWLAAKDRVLCTRFNRVSNIGWLRQLFAIVSRLGDGIFWYTLMAALLVSNGAAALPPVLHMIAVGLICTALYKTIKARTSRPRPYQAQAGITLCVSPLDQFSFPSGHTLHATAFAVVAIAYYPELFWLLLPFATLVALSRVILGLHYPSDVLSGAAIGASVAELSLLI